MNSAVKINESTFQTGFILLPRHAIYSRRGLPFQRVKAVLEQVQRHVVEQSGEPFLLLFRPSWKWRKRSSGKIAERTYEQRTETLHRRREGGHSEAASFGQGAGLGSGSSFL